LIDEQLAAAAVVVRNCSEDCSDLDTDYSVDMQADSFCSKELDCLNNLAVKMGQDMVDFLSYLVNLVECFAYQIARNLN